MRNQFGGKIIGTGSYGCIFLPQLTCKNKSKNRTRKKNRLSKMMINYEALDEFNHNNEIRKKLKQIPNNKKYFIFSDEICKPKTLKKKELKDLYHNCHNMVGEEYLNNKLKNILILNMDYGGLDLDSIILENIYLEKDKRIIFLDNIFDKLIDLIENGMSKMHKKNVYHTDIKALNIVEKGSKLSLIDWGLSLPNKPNINDNIYNGIHFNRPYESLLFNFDNKAKISSCISKFDKLLKNYNHKILSKKIENDVLLLFNIKNNISINSVLKAYLKDMLMLCNKNGSFDKELLLEGYLIKQDYWGLMTIIMDIHKYFDIVEESKIDAIYDLYNYILRNINIKKDIVINLIKKLKSR